MLRVESSTRHKSPLKGIEVKYSLLLLLAFIKRKWDDHPVRCTRVLFISVRTFFIGGKGNHNSFLFTFLILEIDNSFYNFRVSMKIQPIYFSFWCYNKAKKSLFFHLFPSKSIISVTFLICSRYYFSPLNCNYSGFMVIDQN